MKRFILFSLALLLIVSGCAPNYNTDEEVVQETEDEEEQRYIIPTNKLEEDTYRTILPYVPGCRAWLIVNKVRNRYDIDEVEQGLIRQAKDVFDTEEYFFQEGQYLTEDLLKDYLSRQLTEEKLREELAANEDADPEDIQVGLNPPLNEKKYKKADKEKKKEMQEDSPQILSYIHEQNIFATRE